jgi:hypothetical protein
MKPINSKTSVTSTPSGESSSERPAGRDLVHRIYFQAPGIAVWINLPNDECEKLCSAIIKAAQRAFDSANVLHHLPRTDGATDAREAESASGVTAGRG